MLHISQVQSGQLAEIGEICWAPGAGEHLWPRGELECAAPLPVRAQSVSEQHCQPHPAEGAHGPAPHWFRAVQVLALSRSGNCGWNFLKNFFKFKLFFWAVGGAPSCTSDGARWSARDVQVEAVLGGGGQVWRSHHHCAGFRGCHPQVCHSCDQYYLPDHWGPRAKGALGQHQW